MLRARVKNVCLEKKEAGNFFILFKLVTNIPTCQQEKKFGSNFTQQKNRYLVPMVQEKNDDFNPKNND